MIVNYDKENGWSSFINDAFKVSPSQEALDFLDLLNSDKSKSYIDWNVDELVSYAKGLDVADESLISFLKDTSYTEKSLSNYQNYLSQTTSITSKFTSFTSKAGSAIKSFGKSLGANLLNMGAGMLAGVAINGIISGVDYLIHYQDRLIEKGEEAKNSISETFSEFTTVKSSLDSLGTSFADNADDITSTSGAIDVIAQKYSELSQGVNTLNNANKSLSTDEYQSYLDISNELASQFPSLVSGYDAQGNAILNLGTNASDAAQKLNELYNAQMLSANVDMGNQLQDNYKGTMAQIQEYNDEISNWKRELSSLETYDYDINDLMSVGGGIEIDTSSLSRDMRQKLDDVLVDNGVNRIVLDNGNLQINTADISEEAAKQIQAVFTDLESATSVQRAELKKNISTNELLVKDQLSSMAESISQYLQTSSAFTDLNQNLQKAFLSNLTSIDTNMISSEYDGDITRFIYSEFLQPMSELEPEMQDKLASLLSVDPSSMNLEQYQQDIFNALVEAFPDDADAAGSFKKALGFDQVIADTEEKLDVLRDQFGDVVDDLSLDEIEQSYDLVVNDKFSGTFDELTSEIENAKALAATSIDLNVNTQMDAIKEALETDNAGVDYESAITYLEKAKDLFDKGLIGTDDFKSIASYISPTGADDPVNFAENYSKALRYLTEDGQGVQNFLYDLQDKGYVSLETMSDGTQQWTYDIQDLQQAATDMGIGFEFMMDMFGRLEDYGFSNNFVGSVEDGTQRIAELSQELVDAQAELARLEATGADQTAIDQQREKIAGLQSDILATQDATNQLIASSADAYAQQVEAAKATIESLGEERERILSENTYGDDTQAIADLMEQQMRELANSNGLELDSELNVKIKADDEASPIIDDINKKELLEKHTELYAEDEASGVINLWNSLSADSKFTSLSAEDQASYVIDFWNSLTPEQKQAYLDGEITMTDSATGTIQTVDGEIQSLNTTPEVTISATDNANSVINSVRNNLASIDGSTATTYIKTIKTVQTSNASSQGGLFGEAAGTMLAPARASGTAFNMLNLIPAHAAGKVALSRDEKAVVNEEDTESIIRDGVWSLIPGGMHIESLKKGDIILNARQTKSLLQFGRAPGHARAYAQGSLLSAYAGGSGGGSFFVGGSGSSSGMSGAPASSSSSNASTKATQANTKAVEDNTKKTENLKDWIESLTSTISDNVSSLKDAIEDFEMHANQNQAIDKYTSGAQSYVNTLRRSANDYMSRANWLGLDPKYVKKITSGELNIEDIQDEDLLDKIEKYQDYYEKAKELNAEITEINRNIREAQLNKLDNIQDDYEHLVDLSDSVSSYYESVSDLSEQLNLVGDANALLSSMSAQVAIREALLNEEKELTDQLNQLVKDGYVGMYTDTWNEWQEEINGVKQSIIDTDKAIAELKENIIDIRFDGFENSLDDLEHSADMAAGIRDLLSSEGVYADDLSITGEGYAQLALMGTELVNAKQQVVNYSVAIDALNEMYKNGDLTQAQYNERLKEYQKGQLDAVKATQDARDAILDLVKDGIEKATEAMEEYIDKRKEALDKEKEYYDFQKQMSNQSTEINKIRSQIAVLEGDDSLEATAKRRKLNSQLSELLSEYEDQQKEHEYDVINSAYDETLDKFKENEEEVLHELETSLTAQNEAIANALAAVKDNYSEVYGVLGQLADQYQFKLTDSLTSPWESAEDALKQYLDAVGKLNPDIDIDTHPIKPSAPDSSQTTPTTGEADKQVTDKSQTGTWIKQGNQWWYKHDDGSYTQNGWEKIDGKWYRFDDQGWMQSGWQWDDSYKKWYYLGGQNDGSMKTGWIWGDNYKKWYYLDGSGAMVTSQWIDGKYYVDHTGAMATNGYVKDENKELYYWVNGNGVWEPQWNATKPDLKKYKLYYSGGTRRAKDDLAFVDDIDGKLNMGSEVMITRKGLLGNFGGSTIFNEKQKDFLYNLSKNGALYEHLFDSITPNAPILPNVDNAGGGSGDITMNVDFTVQGDMTKEVFPGMKKVLKESFDYTVKQLRATSRKL